MLGKGEEVNACVKGLIRLLEDKDEELQFLEAVKQEVKRGERVFQKKRSQL